MPQFIPVDHDPFALPDVGAPLIGDGGQFSAGTTGGNKAADVGGRYVKHLMDSVATLPQRAIESSQYALDTGNYDPSVPVEAALTLATGGMPMAERGAAGVFGGRLATTASRETLAQAEAAIAQGAKAGDVWANTGWFKGPDGHWRFEIPDQPAQLTGKSPEPGRKVFGEQSYKPMGLSDVLDHPELYKAYPELANVQVHHNPSMGAEASFDPINASISLDMTRPGARESILHEIQHGIQTTEGFAPGGTTGRIGFGDGGTPERQALIDSMSREMRANPRQAEAIAARYDPLIEAETKRSNDLRYNEYRNLAGEVEARNVADRSNMGHNSRRGIAPWESADTDVARQIVNTPNEGMKYNSPLPPSIAAAHDQMANRAKFIPVDYDPFASQL
jgi:hypothetical protein